MEPNRKGFLSHFIIYSRWYTVLILTSIISIIVGFVISYFLDFRLTGWHYYLRVLATTLVLWIGCSTIAIYIWKKYPWILMPFKHLMMEVIGVFCLLTLYFGFTLLIYMYSHVGISLIQSIEIHSIAFIIITFTTFFILAIHEAILFYNQWHEHYSKSIRLEKDTIEAQYNLLKTQINPHFLFNSLTSLMSMVDGNPKAEKYIQTLSDYRMAVWLVADFEALSCQVTTTFDTGCAARIRTAPAINYTACCAFGFYLFHFLIVN